MAVSWHILLSTAAIGHRCPAPHLRLYNYKVWVAGCCWVEDSGSAGVADRSWLAGGCLPAVLDLVPMQRDRDADLRPATCVLSFFYSTILTIVYLCQKYQLLLIDRWDADVRPASI
eukprot:COSAG01_NODE_22896_length_836_cov_2.565807_2_plen_115_part_01